MGEVNGEIVPSFPGFTAEVPHLQGTLSAVSCRTDQLCQVGWANSMSLVFPAVHTVSDCRHATTAGVEGNIVYTTCTRSAGMCVLE